MPNIGFSGTVGLQTGSEGPEQGTCNPVLQLRVTDLIPDVISCGVLFLWSEDGVPELWSVRLHVFVALLPKRITFTHLHYYFYKIQNAVLILSQGRPENIAQEPLLQYL